MGISVNEIRSKAQKSEVKAGNEGYLSKILYYEITTNKLGDAFKESFYGELALLIEAGLNIKAALDLLAAQQKKSRATELINTIIKNLTAGGRLSEVLKDTGQFSAYEYFSVKIGEETGNLVEILERMSNFFSQKIKQRRTIIGALTYPLIVLLTALLAVAFMFTYMVPLFKDVFLRMGGDLPWLTKVIIRISESFGSVLLVLSLIVVVFFIVHIIYRERESYQKIKYMALLKIPVFGTMLLNTYTLRMIQSLGLLITSRVPITEALELSQRMIKFHPISSSLEVIQAKIFQGCSLSEGFGTFKIYDARLVALIKVGEETNRLGLILNKLSLQMEEELEYKAKVLGNTLEPVIIIFLGILVAVILVAMYMPMFQLSTSFG